MRMVDVCAGIGGFSLAATWAGYEVAGQVEIDPWCRRVLAKHWPEALRMSDVFEVRGDEFGPIDLLTAGIPCQPYSVAGKRLGSGDDRALWPAVRSIVEVGQPPRVLIENVAGFINMALDGVSADLEALGYEVQSFVIPAAAVGAPHRRDRVWILADAGYGDGRGWAGDAGGNDANGADTGRAQGAGGTNKCGEVLADSAARGVRRGGSSGQPGLAALGGEDVSGSDGGRFKQRDETERRLPVIDQNGDDRTSDVSNATSNLRRASGHGGSIAPDRTSGSERGGGREALGGMGDEAARLPGRMARSGWRVGPDVLNPWAGDWEDGCPRTTSHEPERTNKLKALGNAIVPQVAYEILRAWEAA